MAITNNYRIGQPLESVYHIASYHGEKIRAEEAAQETTLGKVLARAAVTLEYIALIKTINEVMNDPGYSADFKKAAVFIIVAGTMGSLTDVDDIVNTMEEARDILALYENSLTDLAERFPNLISYDSDNEIISFPWNPDSLPLSQVSPPTYSPVFNSPPTPPGSMSDAPPIPSWLPDVSEPFNDGQQAASPLIIDLDNDGVEATAFNASTTETFFDIDGDGFREQTAWVGADDGLLVRDLNANGLIDNRLLFLR